MSNKTQKWLLISLIVLATNAAIWYFGIAPARAGIAETEQKIAAQAEKETQLLQRLSSLESIDTAVLELEQGEQFVLIPDAGLLREMMTELEAKANEMENELTSINFQPPAQEDVFQSMGISLMMSGKYKNLYEYIKYLETHGRLILVNSFNFGGSDDEISANIQLRLFAHNFDPYTPHEAPGRDNPFSEQ